MNGILNWMDNSGLHRFVVDIPWVFPAAETLHFVGLILLVGSLCVVDLRLLGVGRAIPLTAVMGFLPFSILGFSLNLITGVLFLFADPFRYYPNFSFRLKMFLVVLAGLNALWFKFAVDQRLKSGLPLDWSAKVIAALSLVLWICIIVAGRMIPYVE